MKFSTLKNPKGFVCGVLLSVACLGFAAVGFAEAKAFELQSVLKGNYAHTMRNEFFIREANLCNILGSDNGWGEIIAREESGFDGSVTKSWLIGDIEQAGNNFSLKVKRQVVQKLDSSGKVQMHKIEDVNYRINLYHRMEKGFKAEWNQNGQRPCVDIDGEYITALDHTVMSSEAAMYVLARFMNRTTANRNKLQGAAMMHMGAQLSEVHDIKLVEHHPDHIVTRGTYRVNAAGGIFEYDVVTDNWLPVAQ